MAEDQRLTPVPRVCPLLSVMSPNPVPYVSEATPRVKNDFVNCLESRCAWFYMKDVRPGVRFGTCAMVKMAMFDETVEG
jgi:hypothetical protein